MSTALITGASSGIGYDLAKEFARHGHDLVVLARNREALDKLAQECTAQFQVKVQVLAKDLADPSTPEQVHNELQQRSLPIDILVNNAGFGTHGPFAQRDLAGEIQLVQVNVLAVMQLTRLLLPAMIERRSGRILNVASTAAYVPGPYMASYYASKAFVLSHSVALAEEVRHRGVTVTALCPGPTRTAFQSRAGMEEVKLFSSSFAIMDSPTVAR
ncbi:MAG TPA: SDR family oxidoreductase, partial [Tepidisphaeraceae bacterium]|nr:SDR family oxidoreductase [Tepidisphaeraceae bacterium]